jgi:hypothetical protein
MGWGGVVSNMGAIIPGGSDIFVGPPEPVLIQDLSAECASTAKFGPIFRSQFTLGERNWITGAA